MDLTHQSPLTRVFGESFALHQQGRLAEAERGCREVLRRNPDHREARHLLGLICYQQARYAEALDLIGGLLKVQPDNADAWANFGLTLVKLGRLEPALQSFDRALAIKPNQVTALYNKAAVLDGFRQFDQAIACYDLLLAFEPHHVEALYARARVLRALGRQQEAIAGCDEVLAQQPSHVEALLIRGNALAALHHYMEAIANYEQALAINPGHVEALSNRGTALLALKHYADALASYDRALAVGPNFFDALYNRANVLSELRRYEEALATYDRALKQQPDHMAALNNRGNALQGLGRLTEAVASYDQALAIRPDSAELLHNRGNALLKLQRYEDALASYEQGLRCDPDHQPAFAGVATAALLTCDWAQTTKLVSKLKADVAAGNSTVNPFTFLGYCDSPALQLKCARAFIRRAVPHSLKPLWTGELWQHDKLRIAYLSADFREHATAFLMVELFEQHDRSRFEVLGISYGGPEQSEMRSRLLKAFDQFHDVARQTDQAIATLLHQLQADIVIDLKGSTYGARPAILAHRPAPIQVNYLGYPGTTGADFIDYIIADSTVLPFDQRPYCSENIVHLPDCYQVNVSQRRIAPAPPTRHAAGLPDTGFVFCCFNNNYKITPPLFDVWTRLLHAVDSSVLWLLRDSSGAETNLRDAARSRGIDPDRLVFAERVEPAVHLARHRLADLFLDTLPYNAHTTASDALWMGLPVLTCLGTAFAGRVAASLLRAVGLPDLVTQSLPAYETLALKLAREPALLASFKRRLERNKSTYPLFDTRRFCHQIQTAYTTMWELWQRGEQPHSFKIKE